MVGVAIVGAVEVDLMYQIAYTALDPGTRNAFGYCGTNMRFDNFGAKLTQLSAFQADYIGVPVEGPFKGEAYRY